MTPRRLVAGGDRLQTRGVRLLERAGLPIAPPRQMTPEVFLKYMARDKKVSAGAVRLILLDEIGRSHVSADFDHAALHATLNHFSA